MAGKKLSSLDKVLGRLDRLDAAGLQTLVQRLARERTMLDAVFNILQEGVLVITADGEIDYANDAAAQMIGFKDQSGAAATLWRLVPGLRASLEGESAGGQTLGPPLITREFELTYPQARVVRLYMVPFHEGEKGRHGLLSSWQILRGRKNRRRSSLKMSELHQSCCSRPGSPMSWAIR